tara:strand:- start:779 stop:1093 length:315 start_codon:yes stop_codon:yes gene_type:complete
MVARKKTSSKAQSKTVRLPDGYEHLTEQQVAEAVKLKRQIDNMGCMGSNRKENLLKLIDKISILDYQCNAEICFLELVLDNALLKIELYSSSQAVDNLEAESYT